MVVIKVNWSVYAPSIIQTNVARPLFLSNDGKRGLLFKRRIEVAVCAWTNQNNSKQCIHTNKLKINKD